MDERTKIVSEMREALKKLETQDFSSTSGYRIVMSNVENALFAIYEVGVSRITLTQEEKLEFAPLIQQVLPAIGRRVSYIVSNFPPSSLESSKIERSGFQFLLDYFKDFSTPNNNNDDEGSSIIQDLSDFMEEQDVDQWDKYLEWDFVAQLDLSVGLTKYSTPDVPRHHRWFYI